MFSPVQILQDEVVEERAEDARLNIFAGAIAIGDLVKNTLGPKGMDKILVSKGGGEVQVTNDGATILKSLHIDNPAAKVLVDISKVQDEEVGDGTTSVCIFASSLLREAERLISQKIHPQTVIEGYREACKIAKEALEASSTNNQGNKEALYEDFMSIARTTLSSKVLSNEKEHFSHLSVDAIMRLGRDSSLEHIHIIKKVGGKLSDSYLDEGFILCKRLGTNQPKRLENARILIANTPMDTDKVKVFGSRVRVESTKELAALERSEREKMKEKILKIKEHNINCFINRQLIYNWPEQLFADAGILSIEHADFDGIERLSLVTGGEITSTFDYPEGVKVGECSLIEEIMIGEDEVIKFSGMKSGEACTIVLRGATSQILDEAERSLHDALCVLFNALKDSRIVLGAGCAEMLMADAVEKRSKLIKNKKSLAMEAFATAIRQIPITIADNGGYDSAELLSSLRAHHHIGESFYGLDMNKGKVVNVRDIGIIEPLKLKLHILSSATESAEMIIRVDNIIKSAPRKKERQN